MQDLWLLAVIICAAFAVLLWSTDKFVGAALRLAADLRVSPLVIGVTAVAFGTSAPELAVSVNAAMTGEAELAIGNALGSNIVNLGLVLALTLLIAPISVHRSCGRREMPCLLALTALAGLLLSDFHLSRPEGVLLLVLCVGVIWLLSRQPGTSDAADNSSRPAPSGLWKQWLLLLILLMVIVVSARVLVATAASLAELLGVSQLITGLTVLAVGTSLPELLTSLVAVMRRAPGLALGNIVGSNIFNICGVIGITAAAAPLEILDPSLMSRDFLALLSITLLFAGGLYVKLWRTSAGQLVLGRPMAVMLLSSYLIYMYFIIISALQT